MIEQLYSSQHAAEVLGVTTYWVEKWRREGKLTPLRAGRLLRYPEDEIKRFVGIEAEGEVVANDQVNSDGEAIGELAVAQEAAAKQP